MDETIIKRARSLRAPAELIDWLRPIADLPSAFDSCLDPEHVVVLWRLSGHEISTILRAVARCIPDWQIPPGAPEEVVRADALMRRLLAAYQAGAVDNALDQEARVFARSQLTDWNIARDYSKRGPVAGIPEALPRTLWSFLAVCNALSRLHTQAADGDDWPWPGRLALTIKWIIGHTCMSPDWSYPLSEEQASHVSRSTLEAGEALARRLRALLPLA